MNKIVYKTRVFNFYYGDEVIAFKKFTEKLENPAVVLKTNEPLPETVLSAKGILLTQGTQACIDHINRKIERIKLNKTRATNSLVTLLTTTVDELKQYL